MPDPSQEAVEKAAIRAFAINESYTDQEKAEFDWALLQHRTQTKYRRMVRAALPAIEAQILASAKCGICADGGFDGRGERFVPCSNCELGRRIQGYVNAAKFQAEAQVLDRVRQPLRGAIARVVADALLKHRERPEQADVAAYADAALSTLDGSQTEKKV